VENKFSDGIFAWYCAAQDICISHYGERTEFNRYYNKLAATALYVASLIALISGALFAQSNLSDAVEYEKSIALLKKEENTYKELYSKKFEEFEEVFQNAGVMNSAVDLAEQIKRNSATSPLDFLITLSDIISNDVSTNIQIDKIEWSAINVDEKGGEVSKANFTGKQPVKHDAVVTGRIDIPENNYRDSIRQIQQIIDSLSASSRVEEVVALEMPVDLRSESKFSTESGVEIKRRNNSETTGIFSLRVTMKAPDHV